MSSPPPRRLHCSAALLRLASLTCLTGLSLLAPAGFAEGNSSLLQRIRELLGIQRPLAVGGSRGSAAGLCLLSPWPMQQANGQMASSSVSGAPPIASQQPLAEVQILRAGTLVWRQRASSSAPLPNPLAWPLPPLRPGETVELALRPLGAAAGSFSRLNVYRPLTSRPGPTAASASGTAPPQAQLQNLLRQGQTAEAFALLFDAELAGDASLQPLARAAVVNGCGSSTGG
jgi:hypothetical protein